MQLRPGTPKEAGMLPERINRARRGEVVALAWAQALAIIGQLCGVERAATDKYLDALARQRLRQEAEHA